MNELRKLSTIINSFKTNYFIAYEITRLLGYKNVTVTMKNVSKTNQIMYIDYPGEKLYKLDTKTILIKSEGITELLSNSKKNINKDIINYLKNNDIKIPDKFRYDIPTILKNFFKYYNNKYETDIPDIIVNQIKNNIKNHIKTYIEINEVEDNNEVEDDNELEFIFEDEENEEEYNELTIYSYISNHLCFEYFVGYEIASLVGYSNTTSVIKNNVSKCNQLVFKDYPGIKEPKLDPKTILLTRDGCCELLLKTRKMISTDVIYMLKKFGIETTNKKCLSKEQQTISEIMNIFKIENPVDQYEIENKYRIDLYFPKQKIAIECNENCHSSYDIEKEKNRTEYINKFLDIKDSDWIIFNPDAKDFELSKIIGQIFILMKQKENAKTKMCSTCRKEKPLTNFHQNKSRKDGLEIRCKDCRHEIKMNGGKYKEEKIETPQNKICPQCNIDKLAIEYWKNTCRKDGLNNICKTCSKEQDKKVIETEKVTSKFKICSKCKVSKITIENFHKRKKSFDGYTGVCNICTNLRSKISKEKRKQKESTIV